MNTHRGYHIELLHFNRATNDHYKLHFNRVTKDHYELDWDNPDSYWHETYQEAWNRRVFLAILLISLGFAINEKGVESVATAAGIGFATGAVLALAVFACLGIACLAGKLWAGLVDWLNGE